MLNMPDLEEILLRFAKRNLTDDDGPKAETLDLIRELLKDKDKRMAEAYAEADRRDAEILRQKHLTGLRNVDALRDMIDLKQYHLPSWCNPDGEKTDQ